ncbi:hypothetical protein FL966_01800 [Caproiciproducens galactitolivorans]|nr:hypothetical protein FL966_01800 [Caproiciproducens galactitolivorans]
MSVPSCQDSEQNEGHYTAVTGDDKFVADYTGINIFQVQQMDVFTYWQLLRDAVIFTCQQSEQGRDYLERCWAAEQTEPDRKMLRQYFGKR